MGSIRIRRRTQAGWAVFLIALLPFFFGVLPYGLRYLMDGAWCFLLFLQICFYRSISYETVRPLLLWSAAFFAASAILYLFHFQSPLHYLWAVRNNFRFYPVFLAASVLLTEQDAEDCLRLFDGLFWLNAGVSLFQSFVLGLERDYLGGLFGTEQGCNSYTNLFFVIVITKALLSFLDGEESALRCGAKCTAALGIAVLAELKFFFVEFVLILLLAVAMSKVSRRSLLLIFGGMVGVLLGSGALILLFPEFRESMSLQGLIQTALSPGGYTSSGDLNRLTFIPQINQWFLRDELKQLFGLGLGNCETSGFAFLETAFYRRYSHTHYSWLSTAFLYLEMGYVGLIFLFGFFVLNYRLTARRQRQAGANGLYCRMGKILSLCAMLILIYNSSLRAEPGYMLYLALAFPYMKATERRVNP